jgi:hypothetical protein
MARTNEQIPKGRQDFPHILRLAVSTKCRSVLPLAVGLRSLSEA